MPPHQLAAFTADRYDSMLRTLGLWNPQDGDEARPSPYNLLITHDWMMVVPRSREYFGPISLNALAFAGTFLVRDEADLAELERAGPLTALQHVGVRPPS